MNNDNSEYIGRQEGVLHEVEGDLFQLGMKIDDLERSVAEGRDTPTNNHLFESPNLDNELINRFSNVEEQYQNLMDRYNRLKGTRSPPRQKQLDDIVQQLQDLVRQANGRYSNIPTPDKLESMMQRDIIDKIKQHMASDSPPYFLTEEDGLSSGHSSFGKGHRRRKGGGYRHPRSEEDSDFKPQLVDRLSPIKSRISTHIPDDNFDRHTTLQQKGKPGSLPVSIVSSSSMWQGATSGETLALDDQGVIRDSVSRNGNSSAGSEAFPFPNKSIEEIIESRRQSKINSLYNGRMISSNSPLHDDIKRLDEQLEKVELEEQRQTSAARDSDAATSRHTRSLLGTSPSNSLASRHSKAPSSAASNHKSQPMSSGNRKYSNTEPKVERQKRRVKNRYNAPASPSDSEESTPSEDYDLDDYVKSAGCGLGPRSRFVRSKNKNLQDRWSQTPVAFDRRLAGPRSSLRGPLLDDRLYPGDIDDPYIDDVAYWDGVAFHPSREHIPGKSILRRSSSPGTKHRRNGARPRSLYTPSDIDMLSRSSAHHRASMNLYPDSNVSREYFKMDPYRYFVREYGQRIHPRYDPSMLTEESEEDDSECDSYMEDRRIRSYLDEAVKAAQSMKRYTKRISDLCEQRKLDDDYQCGIASQRNYRDLYAQYS